MASLVGCGMCRNHINPYMYFLDKYHLMKMHIIVFQPIFIASLSISSISF